MRKSTKKNNVTLREKILSNGNISLYLDIYRDGQRKYEFLKLYLNKKARTPLEREQNHKTRLLAEEIRTKRETELNSSAFDLNTEAKRNTDFITYFEVYNSKYTKKDIRMMTGALQRFKDFLAEEYGNTYDKGIKAHQLNKDMMLAFVEYLQSRSKGEGASNYYQRFKKVVKHAVDNDILQKNPCAGVVCKADTNVLRKDVLSIEEMKTLIATTYQGQNQEIRRAFIFCLYTGIRHCDVAGLTYGDVDYSNRLLRFEQDKTKGHSASSWVVIPLNDGLISLIGQPPVTAKGEAIKDALIFDLPSHTMCLKALRRWTARAGIDKHITWHCARHSFAVNILNNGANIKTVASLLGHSGLKHTEKYTRAVDSLKEAAINSLPELKL
ncbi:integrase/recombinase XerD [Parabacteroides sp. PFB2-12]|uniref:site-specific integrase n=1 Tax=unclassified Parabacteroides TaxID=2649774 RepID=UPI002474EAFC|nr:MULTISPECIES: site-specific integrase [unclassified Parabacteroides]MDH6343341.1 integrase/recombinase XerD [Parabacteroides sp. PM6-13]MDH6390357.1 integrase/recombinase XerD [Parabacteroides sp. PFB2-12]